jgi:putative addiction module component (TIGR02574 family)
VNTVIANEIETMSIEEKILLVEDLWDSIALSNQSVPLTDEQKSILDKRLDHFEANPDSGDTWENVRTRITETCKL